jgi:hypothetical protein
MSETDIDPETLAAALDQLEPGTRIGDKFILSKRQLLAAAGGALSAGALISMGIDETQAQQAAGQVGTSSEPNDVFAAGGGNVELEGDVTSQSVTGGYELTIDGDTYQFNE